MFDKDEVARLFKVAAQIPYEDIGKMTVEFARLDLYAHFLAWGVIGDDEAGPAKTQGLATEQVFKAIRTELDAQSVTIAPPFAKSLETLPDDAIALLRRRHVVVHGLWLLEGDAPQAVRIREMIQRGDAALVADRIDPEGVSELTDEATQMNYRIMLLALTIRSSREHGIPG